MRLYGDLAEVIPCRIAFAVIQKESFEEIWRK